MSKYYLDPDFRKDPDTKQPFCCRCQKPLKGEYKAVRVDWSTWHVEEHGPDKMGLDCWKRITKAKR